MDNKVKNTNKHRKDALVNRPRYLQIAEQLEQRINSGEFPPGSMFPTEQELQQQFGVSRVTIRKALAILTGGDYLYRVRGSGTYVKMPQAEHNAFVLSGFFEEVSAQGKIPSSRLLHFSVETADAIIARKLCLEEKDMQIYKIIRLRLIDGAPEVLEYTYMPLMLFPDLSVEVMMRSKYHYIEKEKGYRISLSRQDIIAENADTNTSELLSVPEKYPLLKVCAVGELVGGQPFEYTVHYFRINQYRFKFISKRRLD
ncbi:GntR family transcriptional regulator [Serratia marcescens]|uniref:GntR family transcriptional regulator n=1 Tax=Serratia marcescens TaxID=615 RepID=UPI0018D7BBDE|nr:GntR family transcriptional regulator [Serratia marcescens]